MELLPYPELQWQQKVLTGSIPYLIRNWNFLIYTDKTMLWASSSEIPNELLKIKNVSEHGCSLIWEKKSACYT